MCGMKIAIFSLAYPPFVGGAEVAIKEITDRIGGKDFYCFTNRFDKNWPPKEKIRNVEVIRLGLGKENYYGNFFQKIFYIFRAWRAAEKIHKAGPFDAIWGIMAAYGGLAALLFKLRHPSVPFLLTLQEGDPEAHILKRVNIFYPLWRLIFKKSDYIQSISRYLEDFAKRHGAECEIEIIPNGVSLEKFKSLKSRFPGSDSKIVITTSRLVYKNGIDTLIRALAVIESENIRLQILGSGPEEENLKNLAKNLNIGNRVEFLGHVDPEEIPAYLAKADIFARASRSEGLGSSFLEAMAAGLPIIGTNIGGIPDFLKDGETGLFAEVDNHKDLAEKITILFKDEKLRSRIAKKGETLVKENYSWDGIAGRMNRIFKKISAQALSQKILIATGLYPPEIGGPATYTVLMERELSQRNFNVSVLPFGSVRRYPKVIRHFSYFLECVFQSIGKDLIFSQDPVSVGLPALLAARLLGKKFVIRVAGDYAWEQASQRFGISDGIDEFQTKKYGWQTELLRKVQKWVVGKADAVVTPSKYFQKLVSGWISDPQKVRVIYNGIPIENSKQIQNSDSKISKIIFSAGRLVPWKGFDSLIEIMKELPGWKLIIAGDGPEKQNLESRILNLELQNRVQLTGSIPREKLLEYLHGADIFVLNTSFESFSFQVVEAMAAGIPVVTTNIGNLQEIIKDKREGILVAPNDKDAILSAINKISSDEKFRNQIIANAQEKAEEFSIGKTADNLSKLLWSLR